MPTLQLHLSGITAVNDGLLANLRADVANNWLLRRDVFCECCGTQSALCQLGAGAAYSGYICTTCLADPPTCPGCNERMLYSHEMSSSGITWRLCRQCTYSERRCPTCARYVLGRQQSQCCACSPPDPTAPRCPRCWTRRRPGPQCHRCRAFWPEPDTFKIIQVARPAGVELEFIANDVPADVITFGHVHGDGSVGPRAHDPRSYEPGPPADFSSLSAYELSMRPDVGDRLAKNIMAACAAIKTARVAYTNDTCGTHTHVYVADLPEEKRARIRNHWRWAEDLFFHTLPPYRKESTYAKPCASIPVDSWTGKYYAMNLDTLREHGTYEFRLHHGTLNGPELVHWVNLMLHFVHGASEEAITLDQSRKLMREPRRALFKRLITMTNMPLSLKKFILMRAERYWTRRCGIFTKPKNAVAPEPLTDAQIRERTIAAQIAVNDISRRAETLRQAYERAYAETLRPGLRRRPAVYTFTDDDPYDPYDAL